MRLFEFLFLVLKRLEIGAGQALYFGIDLFKLVPRHEPRKALAALLLDRRGRYKNEFSDNNTNLR